MIVLGIDTSCDDTCASVVAGQQVLSNVVSSQVSLHQPYGGVFPSVAKLAHQQNIAPVVNLALKRSHLHEHSIQAIAVTIGPGLAPALEIGLSFAKKLAQKWGLPLLPINHLEGHLLSPLLQAHSAKSPTTTVGKNCLGMVISGGHSQFIRLKQLGSYQILGETLDDAIGESLDKIGRLLSLGYPAGPALEILAKEGDAHAYQFPLPLTTRHNYDLSFSGLKTFSKNLLARLTNNFSQPLTKKQIVNLAASSQTAVFRHLLYKLEKLLSQEKFSTQIILVGGGVAANNYLRSHLRRLGKKYHYQIALPYHRRFCGDNAAMIALVGQWQLASGYVPPAPQTIERQPNWQLTSWQEAH